MMPIWKPSRHANAKKFVTLSVVVRQWWFVRELGYLRAAMYLHRHGLFALTWPN